MNQELIELAKQAGFQERYGMIRVMHSSGAWVCINDQLTEFAELVADKECEACGCARLTTEIRARGQKDVV